MKDISSFIPLSGLLAVALLVFVFIYVRSLFSANHFGQERKKIENETGRRDEQLKREAEEVIRLAHQGDPRACAVVARHLGDPKNSDFQGLIDVDDNGIPVFTDSSKNHLEWHIIPDDDGRLEVKMLPKSTGVWEPSRPSSIE